MTVAGCAVYAQFGPDQGRLDIGWGVVIALFLFAVVGELIELLTAALGAKRAGASKRGAILALIGSLVGGVIGMFVGIPIPVIGPLVGAVLCGGVGALAGAVLGEQWKGRAMNESLRIGHAAFWGRLFGTLGKTLVGAVMLVLVISAVIL